MLDSRKIKHFFYCNKYKLRRLLYLFHIKIRRRNIIVDINPEVRLERNIDLYLSNTGSISIDGNTLICRDSKIVIRNGNLKIGNHCTFGVNTIFNTFDNITIGDGVLTADRVSFITNIHHYKNVDKYICDQATTSAPITIGEGTWIGLNAVILPGTTIGKNCVIGANAVVKGTFPNYCVIGGGVARIIKRYNSDQGEWINENWNYNLS